MKKKLAVLCVFFLVFIICGCTGTTHKDDGPKDETVLADLQNSLTRTHRNQYGYDIRINSWSVEKSKSEEDTYTATISVLAESEYAQLHYLADILYTKYDQGWQMDECGWEFSSYDVVAYPDETLQASLTAAQGLEDLSEREIIMKEGSFICKGNKKEAWNIFVDVEFAIEAVWNYNLHTDAWEFAEQRGENQKFCFKDTLEGTWPLAEAVNAGTMTISNVTDNALDFCLKSRYYTTETFHVEVDGESWDVNDDCFLVLELTNPSGTNEINVSFYKREHTYREKYYEPGYSYTSRWFVYLGDVSAAAAYIG